uniref:SMP-LTD domain-containing protein n=1 Tax=Steinernema glaseri TaxID=37863 RepID=A0A1I7YWG3_9BILA
MDGITWLLFTWIVVGVLCYFAVNKMGTQSPESDAAVQKQNMSSSTAVQGTSKSNNCDWANDIIAWLFQYLHHVPEPLEAWIKSLNDAAKKAHTNNCEVLFEGFGDHSDVHLPPKLSDIVVEHGPRDHLTLRAHIDLPEVRVKLVTSQRTFDHMSVSNYDAFIRDLHGEVEGRIACIANQVFFMGCFNGRPEMDIQLVNRDSSQISQVSTTFVEEMIRRCLVSAVTNINLSESISASGGNLVEISKSSVVTAPVHEIVRRLHQSHLVDHNTTASAPPNKLRPLLGGGVRVRHNACKRGDFI